jgi:PAS domain S-box-containing protein
MPLQRTARRLGQPAVRYAVMVATIGLILTATAAAMRAEHNDEAIHDDLQTRGAAFGKQVQERLQIYEYGLRGARGAVIGANFHDLNHQRFRNYARSRDIDREFPGARGFGFIRRVFPEHLDTFLAEAGRDRGGPFVLGTLDAAHSEHWVIQYIEPEDRNKQAIGLDIASESRRRAAAIAAMDSGTVQMTAPMTLVQATGQPYQGFLFLIPVYDHDKPLDNVAERRAATLGWAYAPLVLTEVLEDISDDFLDLALEITDITDASADPILATHDTLPMQGGHQYVIELPVYGRVWSLRARPDALAAKRLNLTPPGWVAFGGGGITLLLSALGFAIRLPIDRRQQIAAEAEALSSGVINSSPQAIVVVDEDGHIVQANARVQDILGRMPADLIGQAIEVLIPVAQRHGHQHKRSGYDRAVRRMGARQDLHALHASGREFPVEVMLSPLQLGARRLTVASIVDVTEQRLALERLRESESRWRELANSMPQLVWALTPEGDCEFLSRQWLAYTGVDEQAQLGHGWRAQLHPSDQTVFDRAWAAAAGTVGIFRSELRIRAHDGCYRWFDTQAVPLRDLHGNVTRWIGSNTDIQERKQMEGALRELNQSLEQRVVDRTALLERARHDLCNILDTMPSMVAYWDRHQINRFANHAYRDWFNVDPETVPGTHIRDLLGAELYEQNRPHIEAALRGEPQQFERQIGAHYSLARYLPDRDGDDIKGFYAFVTDVTDIRRAAEAAEAANAAKSAFVANMSHEIRTPMNAVLNVAYLLAQSPLDGDQKGLVDKLDIAGRALMALIDDILDLSKIEAGEMAIAHEPFSLHTVLDEAVKLARPASRRKGLTCTLHRPDTLPDRLVGDAHRLGQILNNLLGNAVKFTAEGSVTLAVRCLPSATGDVALAFDVRDTGIGIAAELQPRLYQPFVQADITTTRRFGGTGLGLAVVKRLVDLMGGRMELNSTAGTGSCFTVYLTLPACDSATTADLAPPRLTGTNPRSGHKRLAGRRILVVDDSAINLDIADKILTLHGATVVRAEDGRAALAVLDHSPDTVDLVLMDIQMPVMDGLEATRSIRARKRFTDLPIVAITAGALANERQAAMDAGMNAFVVKPFNPEGLLQRIDTLLTASASSVPTEGMLDRDHAPASDAALEFDLSGALARVDGDHAFLATLLQQFAARYGNDNVLPPTTADDATALEHLARQAHALRGAAANVGGSALVAAAGLLEQRCRSGQLTTVAAALKTCREQLDTFLTVAADWRDSVPTSAIPAIPSPPQATPAYVARVRALLQEHRLEALEAIAAGIDWSELLGVDNARAFNAAAEALDFDGALILMASAAPAGSR